MKKKSNATEIYGKIISLQKAINTIEEIIDSVFQKSDSLDFDSTESKLAEVFTGQLYERQEVLLAKLRPLQKAYYGI